MDAVHPPREGRLPHPSPGPRNPRRACPRGGALGAGPPRSRPDAQCFVRHRASVPRSTRIWCVKTERREVGDRVRALRGPQPHPPEGSRPRKQGFDGPAPTIGTGMIGRAADRTMASFGEEVGGAPEQRPGRPLQVGDEAEPGELTEVRHPEAILPRGYGGPASGARYRMGARGGPSVARKTKELRPVSISGRTRTTSWTRSWPIVIVPRPCRRPPRSSVARCSRNEAPLDEDARGRGRDGDRRDRGCGALRARARRGHAATRTASRAADLAGGEPGGRGRSAGTSSM